MVVDEENGSDGPVQYAVWTLAQPPNASGETQGTVKKTILNACLALTKHLMSCRPKSHIEGVICSRFTLDKLKEARQIIHTFNNTDDEPYAYRGPNKKPKISDGGWSDFRRC